MNCNDILPLICGYLDGENTESEQKKLESHLKTCASCREQMAQMQENDRLLAQVPEMPSDLTWRIMQEVRKEPKKRNRWRQWSAGLSAAAVLVVVLLSGVFAPHRAKDDRAELKAESVDSVHYRAATEVNVPAEAVTEAFLTGEMAEAGISIAAYLFTDPVAELDALSPMDLNEARTLLTAEAAARLDVLTKEGLQAYLISEEMMQALQAQYPAELLSDNAEAETYLVFLSAAEAKTP